ncbi:MAG: cytochrome c3 family protein [Desulfobacterales bacterium]|uniref:Cytochrome c3 family protein n=1 Tax=Candidatus Desulfatibia profunda TaxID=2841695 RepID=A0A8J6NUR8_9BACT|nr:cytochrome c3 family protein [Candidatus Desulfatibia profunda]MBL7179645.1 cytochrome c3 family protein [Desulfobacterales bacterium]
MFLKRPGTISSLLNKKIIFILLIQAIIVISLSGYHAWRQSSAECIRCHSDLKKLAELGHPEFYITPEMVAEQSRHSTAECRDCHLGNGRATDKDKAHQGMLKMLIIGDEAELKPRKTFYPSSLQPTGPNRLFELIPKMAIDGGFRYPYEVRTILWHDRNPETYNFDPELAQKTCGRSGCHPEQLQQFKTTIMGRNFRQRTMRTWLDPYGPHNCGPSFADLPPSEILTAAGFDYANTERIRQDLNLPFTSQQARDKQRICNTCHAGCLDCHFAPRAGQPHRFAKTPKSESCSGFGRGSMCHSGSMESRRGETYIGTDYAIPSGMESDVHYKNGIECMVCHPTGKKGMGDMERKADCQDCHIAIEKAHANSIHKNLDCAACHVNALGGYQITIWGPGFFADTQNPFYKYALYYGVQKPPILMKDRQGVWMPVKIMPHAVGNIKPKVSRSPSVQFRWPAGETKDAYYIIGTFNGLAENNNHLLWLEIQQAAHPFGQGRTCESCHQEKQISVSTWEFLDGQGTEKTFTGTYDIVADQRALFIRNMHNTSPILPFEGYNLSDFASWLFLKDQWKMEGDFGIKTDESRYRLYLEKHKTLTTKLKKLDLKAKQLDKKTLRLYRNARGKALHNLEDDRAASDLENFFN